VRGGKAKKSQPRRPKNEASANALEVSLDEIFSGATSKMRLNQNASLQRLQGVCLFIL